MTTTAPLSADRAAVLAHLRAEIARRHADWREADEERRLPTGVAEVDRLIGGLARGEITHLAGRVGAGRTTLMVEALVRAQRAGLLAAWIEPAPTLNPEALLERGVDLSSLLMVRASGDDAVWAAQELCRSEAFALVVLEADRVARPASVRLLDAARAGKSALVVLGETVPGASTALRMSPVFDRQHRRARLVVERSRRGDGARCEFVLPEPDWTPPDAWQPPTDVAPLAPADETLARAGGLGGRTLPVMPMGPLHRGRPGRTRQDVSHSQAPAH